MKLLNRRKERKIANAVIADPEDHTVMDPSGAVRSIQAANVDMPDEQLDALWSATTLERLARTYWKYLSRISLGLIRVVYSDTGREVVFITKPFVLLRFHPPEYELGPTRGIVRWNIRNGILVAKRDQGHLEIDVRRCPCENPGFGRVHVEVEVSNFYPMLARPFRWFYANTQSRIHVVVTHGFLRSLARLQFEESVIGRFASVEPVTAGEVDAGAGNGNGAAPRVPQDREEITIGDTPWGVIAAIATAAAAAGVLVGLSIRRR